MVDASADGDALAKYRDIIVALKDVKANSALMWASQPKGPDKREHLLHGLLHGLLGSGLYGKPLSRSLLRQMCAAIDELHRDGVRWPIWEPDVCGPGNMSGKVLYIRAPITRKQSPRPSVSYCTFWNGAFWVPCDTPKRRKEAGYVGLLMCWPPPLPKPGDYICSGARARFAYRIVEVERFAKPRTAKRYTCRLWCDRIDPADIPNGAQLHSFYWHKRNRSNHSAARAHR
jgi:hypothetical protein